MVIAAAYVLAPRRPGRGQPASAWITWAAWGLVPFAAGAALFLALDPMMWMYFDKFKDDLRTIVVRAADRGEPADLDRAIRRSLVPHALLGHEHPLVQPGPGIRILPGLPASSGSFPGARS